MKLLIDECLRADLASALRSAGFDAVHVTEIGLAGSTDAALMETARSEGRTVVSADTDFGELLARTHQTDPSVILFRRHPHDTASMLRSLTAAIAAIETDLHDGAIAVIGRERLRIRRLPIGGA